MTTLSAYLVSASAIANARSLRVVRCPICAVASVRIVPASAGAMMARVNKSATAGSTAQRPHM
eukprot:1506540-Pyramimonas_sp.AAC.1